jgi:hypothetical protein
VDRPASLPVNISIPSQHLKATFVEVIGANSVCLSPSVAVIRSHACIESIVEVIVQARSLNTAITTFIKRVVEETVRADESQFIISSKIKVIMSTSESNTPRLSSLQRVHARRHVRYAFETIEYCVQDINNKREQVLSSMKAAAVDGGDIYLEFFLKVTRLLASPIQRSGSSLNSISGNYATLY